MIEYYRGSFHQIDKNFYPAFSKDSTLGYSYFPPDYAEMNVRPDVAVFKHETGQYIIGPQDEVLTIARGLNIADSLGYQHLRQMHEVITHAVHNSTEPYIQYTQSQPISDEIIRRFGIKQLLKQSKYNFSLSTLGVYCDIANPIFFSSAIEEWRIVDPFLAEILAVSNIVHEWGHVTQYREQLPVHSLWAERHAATEQCIFISKILNSNVLNKWQQEQLNYILSYYSQRIFDYRNGNNFNDHLINDYQFNEGTPQRSRSIHNEDYKFGNY